MTWIIVILLALILAALVSSNQGSAEGVKKTIKYGFLVCGGLFFWLVFIVTLIWSTTLNNTSDEAFALSALAGIVVPPLYLWIYRREIRDSYSTDRRRALKKTLRILGYVAAGLIVMVLFQLLKKEGLDVLLLLSVIVVTGIILLGRSLGQRNKWREVWFGAKQPPNILDEMENARAEAYAQDRAIWKEESANWDDKSQAEKDNLNSSHRQRGEETDKRLRLLEIMLHAQHDAWNKQSLLSVRYVFWIAVIGIGVHICTLFWDWAYAYALGTSFVSGRGWLAAGSVIVAAGVLYKAAYEVIQMISEQLEEKKSTKSQMN